LKQGKLTYDWWGDEHGKLSVTATDVEYKQSLVNAPPLVGRPPIDALSLTTPPTPPSVEPLSLSSRELSQALRHGQLIELSVSHCDPVISLHDQIYIVKDDIVVDVWRIDARGKCQ
jgi:hypothetical protein